MADEPTVSPAARRAAAYDAPTMVLPVIGARSGARRSVTPDWDDDDDDDVDNLDDVDDVDETPPPSPTETPRWTTQTPALPVTAVPPPAPTVSRQPPAPPAPQVADSHDPFRPPADDADTVVIKRGDIAAALAAMGAPEIGSPSTPAPSATPTWRPVTPTPAAAAAEAEPVLTATEKLVGPPPEAPADPAPPRTSKRPAWLLPVALAAAVVLFITGIALWGSRDSSPTGPTSSRSASASASAANPLTEADLVGIADAALSVPVAWSVQSTTSPVLEDSPTPLCVAAQNTGPKPVSTFQRALTGAPATMLHRAEWYGSVGDATSAMAARMVQLGRCSNTPAYLTSGAEVTGVGDKAVAVTAVVQDPTPQYHSVVLVRTGTVINVIDVWQPATAIGLDKAIASAAATVTKQCGKTGGTCVTTAAITAGPPPAGGNPGWLTVADLPRITPGFGRWTTTDPSTSIRIIGSQCENVTFATAAGPTQKRQRTFLLTEDNVPKGFGLDELLLDFDSAQAAATYGQALITNIESCSTRVPTAKLGNGGSFTGTGVGGEPITGYWRTVSQPTSASTVATFRVVVAAVDKRVVYLLLTPSGTYDLTDESWAALGLRAAQRATQQA